MQGTLSSIGSGIEYHELVVCGHRATANNQLTINLKDRKKRLLWDPDPSPSLPFRTHTNSLVWAQKGSKVSYYAAKTILHCPFPFPIL